METIKLTDGHLLYQPDFYNTSIADKLFNVILEKVNWKQEKTSWGNSFPRLTAYFADPGVKYEYSGVAHQAVSWPIYLQAVKEKVQEVTSNQFNSLLLNFYKDGDSSIGWHSDDEKELGTNPVVASISLGGERNFQLRHKRNKEKWNIILKNGSLIVMCGAMQHNWQHSIPKTTKIVFPRINLTFRNIV